MASVKRAKNRPPGRYRGLKRLILSRDFQGENQRLERKTGKNRKILREGEISGLRLRHEVLSGREELKAQTVSRRLSDWRAGVRIHLLESTRKIYECKLWLHLLVLIIPEGKGLSPEFVSLVMRSLVF